MLKNFKNFINENYTLTIEDSMDDFDIQEIDWELEYNMSDIYLDYKKNKNSNEFLNQYKNKLIEKKDKLISIGKDCWNDLVNLLKENNSENVLPYLDRIYDWADKYGIKISIKNNGK